MAFKVGTQIGKEEVAELFLKNQRLENDLQLAKNKEIELNCKIETQDQELEELAEGKQKLEKEKIS